jgi:excinuclease ABC subunit C
MISANDPPIPTREADLPFDPNAAASGEADDPLDDAASLGDIAAERAQGIAPDQLDTLPQLPGVYIMRDAADRVVYIGKAGNLASRVRSYFTKAGDARFNVRFLMRHVARVETIVTANEKEAFLLEDTLIKRHQPRYNLRLRDDKTYVSVRVNMNHPWPRAVVLRRRESGRRKEPGVLHLGPYSSAAGARDTLRQLQRIFPVRSCPDHVLNNRARPCLLHQIGRCCAPCTEPVDADAYREMVEGTILVLKGRTREVLDQLTGQMNAAADAMDFERAAAIRDRIAAIRDTTERQGVHRHDGDDRDAVVLERRGGFGAFVVFVWRGGLLVSSRPYLVRDHERPSEDMMEEFLGRYYQLEPPPREVLAAPEPRGRELLEELLADRREASVQILAPQRGEKMRQIDMARENARRLLDQHLSGRRTLEEIEEELRDKLHLPERPETIECFDISTIQGTATVGSMVAFRGGEPDKSRYRRFRIRTLDGQDDFAAMREMLTRRLRRIAEGIESAPGLIVIDGGKGQLAVAVDALQGLGLAQIPVVGMAKSRVKRRGDTVERTEERFFLPGRMNPVVFRAGAPALHLLVRLRDEAHRFAIAYHREVRGRANLRSSLESIEGVGKNRAAALLRHFGSMKKLRGASTGEIAAVKGVPKSLADRIAAHLAAQSPAPAPAETGDNGSTIQPTTRKAP